MSGRVGVDMQVDVGMGSGWWSKSGVVNAEESHRWALRWGRDECGVEGSYKLGWGSKRGGVARRGGWRLIGVEVVCMSLSVRVQSCAEERGSRPVNDAIFIRWTGAWAGRAETCAFACVNLHGGGVVHQAQAISHSAASTRVVKAPGLLVVDGGVSTARL